MYHSFVKYNRSHTEAGILHHFITIGSRPLPGRARSSNMAASNIIRRGSCLCRNVKFTLTGSPARHIQCNCLNCQKASGSAFLTNILYKRSVCLTQSSGTRALDLTDSSLSSNTKSTQAPNTSKSSKTPIPTPVPLSTAPSAPIVAPT